MSSGGSARRGVGGGGGGGGGERAGAGHATGGKVGSGRLWPGARSRDPQVRGCGEMRCTCTRALVRVEVSAWGIPVLLGAGVLHSLQAASVMCAMSHECGW